MLHPVLFSSFHAELEKRALAWQVPVVTGLLGAGTGAYLAGKTLVPEHRQEQFMRDMDTMPEEVFKMRAKRRAAALAAAVALGAVTGASLPYAAEYGAGRIGEFLGTKGKEVAHEGKEVAREAGKNFAEGMAGQFDKHKTRLADAVEDMGQRAAKGAKREWNLRELLFGPR